MQSGMVLRKAQFNRLAINILFVLIASTNCFNLRGSNPKDSVFIMALYDSAKEFIEFGENNQAINLLLEIEEEIKDEESVSYIENAKLYNKMGVLYRRNGEFSKAIGYYKKAIQAAKNQSILPYYFVNVGVAYSSIGDFSNAIHYYEMALERANGEGEGMELLVYINHNLALVYNKLSQPDLALRYYLGAIKAGEEIGHRDLGDSYYGCAMTYQYLSGNNLASEYHKRSITNYQKVYGKGHYKTAMSLINYAEFLILTEDLDAGYEILRKAYNILLETVGVKHAYTADCYDGFSRYHAAKGDNEKALLFLQKALVAKIRSFNSEDVFTNPTEDIYPDLELIELLKSKGSLLRTIRSEGELTKNLLASLKTLELAAFYIEKLRTGYLFESSKLILTEKENETIHSIIEVSNELYYLTGKMEFADEAFEYSERGKYATLRDMTVELEAKMHLGIPASLIETDKELRIKTGNLKKKIWDEENSEYPDTGKIHQWNENVFSLSIKRDSVQNELRNTYPRYHQIKYSKEVISRKELQHLLREDDCAIEYTVTDSLLFVFLITKDTFIVKNKVLDSMFFSELDHYIDIMHRKAAIDKHYRQVSNKLYKVLLGELLAGQKGKSLIIVPDGRLQFIAFESLITDTTGLSNSIDYRKDKYLILDYPVSYNFSFSLMQNNIGKEIERSFDFVAMAPDYTYSPEEFRTTPFLERKKGEPEDYGSAIRETKLLAEMMKGKSVSGINASESNFRRFFEQASVFHIYAHGLDNQENPLYSKIELINKKDSINDGELYAYEIYNFRSNAELTVLAACNTGFGKAVPGEGILSFGRSFGYTGTSAIIMNLWLGEYFTMQKMFRIFYEKLKKGSRKDVALQKAKIEALHVDSPTKAHPRYWATTVLYGNPYELKAKPGKNFGRYLLVMALLVVSFGVFRFYWKRRKIRTL